MTRKHVLILCTGNSCRSQMAEALVNHCLGEEWHASSAGTEPAGYVHPLAILVLEEIGLPTEGLRSKSTDEFRDATPDLVVTVCDDAAENCPVWLGSGRRIHMGFPDPAHATGTEAQRLGVFRGVRDAIKAELLPEVRLDPGISDTAAA
jgi:arsenate reductase